MSEHPPPYLPPPSRFLASCLPLISAQSYARFRNRAAQHSLRCFPSRRHPLLEMTATRFCFCVCSAFYFHPISLITRGQRERTVRLDAATAAQTMWRECRQWWSYAIELSRLEGMSKYLRHNIPWKQQGRSHMSWKWVRNEKVCVIIYKVIYFYVHVVRL